MLDLDNIEHFKGLILRIIFTGNIRWTL